MQEYLHPTLLPTAFIHLRRSTTTNVQIRQILRRTTSGYGHSTDRSRIPLLSSLRSSTLRIPACQEKALAYPKNGSLYKTFVETSCALRPWSPYQLPPCRSPVLSPNATNAPRSLRLWPTGTARSSSPPELSNAARSRVPLNCCRQPTCWLTMLPI